MSLPTGHTPVVTLQVTKLIGSSHQAVLEGLSEPTALQIQIHWSLHGLPAATEPLVPQGWLSWDQNPTASCLCSLPRDRWHRDMGQVGYGPCSSDSVVHP